MIPDYELGQMAKDKVTGFEGLLIGKIVYLYGCTQYGLAPRERDKEKKTIEAQWFDEGRIELTKKKGLAPAEVAGNRFGGPNRDAPPGR